MSEALHNYLILRVGPRLLSLPVEAVARVVARVAATPLVDEIPGIEGVIRFAETTILVVDLRQRLGLAPRAPQLQDRLVLATLGAQTLGMHVDDAIGVVEVPAALGDADRAEQLTQRAVTQGKMAATDGVVLDLDLDGLAALAGLGPLAGTAL